MGGESVRRSSRPGSTGLSSPSHRTLLGLLAALVEGHQRA